MLASSDFEEEFLPLGLYSWVQQNRGERKFIPRKPKQPRVIQDACLPVIFRNYAEGSFKNVGTSQSQVILLDSPWLLGWPDEQNVPLLLCRNQTMITGGEVWEDGRNWGVVGVVGKGVWEVIWKHISRSNLKNNWKHSITLRKFHSQDRRPKDWVIEWGWEEGYGSEKDVVNWLN